MAHPQDQDSLQSFDGCYGSEGSEDLVLTRSDSYQNEEHCDIDRHNDRFEHSGESSFRLDRPQDEGYHRLDLQCSLRNQHSSDHRNDTPVDCVIHRAESADDTADYSQHLAEIKHMHSQAFLKDSLRQYPTNSLPKMVPLPSIDPTLTETDYSVTALQSGLGASSWLVPKSDQQSTFHDDLAAEPCPTCCQPSCFCSDYGAEAYSSGVTTDWSSVYTSFEDMATTSEENTPASPSAIQGASLLHLLSSSNEMQQYPAQQRLGTEASPPTHDLAVSAERPIDRAQNKPHTGKRRRQPASASHPTEDTTIVQDDGDDSERARQDQLLLTLRAQQLPYKEIKRRGNFTEAESTLRGRYRVLVKAKEDRLRKPEWTQNDAALLVQTVDKFYDENLLTRRQREHGIIPWKLISEELQNQGASYPFTSIACSKKYDEYLASVRFKIL